MEQQLLAIGAQQMAKTPNQRGIDDLPEAKVFVSGEIPIRIVNPDRINKADLEFEDVDHSNQSYEARIFLNNPNANRETPLTNEMGYAGSFFVFGHGGRCYGGLGHCKVREVSNPYDIRRGNPMTPAYAFVRVTEQVKKIVAQKKNGIIVTVVPVAQGYDEENEIADLVNLFKFKNLRLIIYDK